MNRGLLEESSFETKGHNHCQKAITNLAAAERAFLKAEKHLQQAKDHHMKASRRLMQVGNTHPGYALLAERINGIGRRVASTRMAKS